MNGSVALAYARKRVGVPDRRLRKKTPEADREIRANIEREASATKRRLLPCSLPSVMHQTVFFLVKTESFVMQPPKI